MSIIGDGIIFGYFCVMINTLSLYLAKNVYWYLVSQIYYTVCRFKNDEQIKQKIVEFYNMVNAFYATHASFGGGLIGIFSIVKVSALNAAISLCVSRSRGV